MLVICSSDLIGLMGDQDDEYWPDLGGTSSMYEDALDERIDSDSELRELCAETKKVLLSRTRDRERTRPFQLSPPIPPTYSKQASSSSEHSSIEKIQPSTIRRNYHGSRARKSKSAASSREDSGEARTHPMQYMYPSMEWQLYPVLLQLSQTLQAMSAQLHEMDTANRLQLRIVYQILRMIINFKRESSQGWLPRWVWPSLRWMAFIFLWPLLARIIWIWYSKRRFLLVKTLTKYL